LVSQSISTSGAFATAPVEVFSGKFIGAITGRALKRLMRMVSFMGSPGGANACSCAIINIRHETKSVCRDPSPRRSQRDRANRHNRFSARASPP